MTMSHGDLNNTLIEIAPFSHLESSLVHCTNETCDARVCLEITPRCCFIEVTRNQNGLFSTKITRNHTMLFFNWCYLKSHTVVVSLRLFEITACYFFSKINTRNCTTLLFFYVTWNQKAVVYWGYKMRI